MAAYFDTPKIKKKSKKVEETNLKSYSEKLKTLFFHTAWAAQKDQTEELVFQNVAYRPTVYKKGTSLI